MQLSRASIKYIENIYATAPALKKSTAFSIVAFCSSHFHDPIKLLCERMCVSRSGYYKWFMRKESPDKQAALVQEIRRYQAISNYTTGYRKIAVYLRLYHKADLSPITVYRLMQRYGLLSRSIRTKQAHLISKEVFRYQNLLNRDFDAEYPNQKWCIDITQFYTKRKKMYLCAIIDLYDRSIVSYRVSDKQNKPLVKMTISAALKKIPDRSRKSIILHSDQGTVFSTKAQRHYLKAHNLRPSMSASGTPYDNAVIESFFSSLKSECLHLIPRAGAPKMIASIDRYITFYNYYRIHMKYENSPMNIRAKVTGLINRNTSKLVDTFDRRETG